MARKSIAWILEFTSNLPNEEEKIKCLRANETVLKDVLRYTFDPRVEWLLPEGTPPYVQNVATGQEHVFYGELRKLYLFIKGGNDNLNQLKREKIFIDMLETISAEDAAFLLSIKEKKMPYKGITSKLVLKAFPGLY